MTTTALSDLDRLLESVRWTLDTYIAPTLTDPLAQSYARTLTVMLQQIAARVRHEPQALAEELTDLRSTLTVLLPALPSGMTAPARHALELVAEPPMGLALAELEAGIACIDAVLAAAANQLDDDARAALDALLVRRLQRRRRWLSDETPPNAF